MNSGPPVPQNLHATALTYDGVGVLIAGPSGSGKSLLALDLIDHAGLAGLPAALIADDQVLVEAAAGVLLAAAPPTVAGRIELRGRGIVTRPHHSPAPVHLLLDLVARIDRMPDPGAFTATVGGVTLPRAPVPAVGAADPVQRRLLALEAIALRRGRKKKTT
ncbi:MAG TPA: hypothetical protein VMW31_06170 [Devosiaceae bacterium]|nr:hypothetical protein [Devosiaceae bacterium]